jgi:hypothetical protein
MHKAFEHYLQGFPRRAWFQWAEIQNLANLPGTDCQRTVLFGISADIGEKGPMFIATDQRSLAPNAI